MKAESVLGDKSHIREKLSGEGIANWLAQMTTWSHTDDCWDGAEAGRRHRDRVWGLPFPSQRMAENQGQDGKGPVLWLSRTHLAHSSFSLVLGSRRRICQPHCFPSSSCSNYYSDSRDSLFSHMEFWATMCRLAEVTKGTPKVGAIFLLTYFFHFLPTLVVCLLLQVNLQALEPPVLAPQSWTQARDFADSVSTCHLNCLGMGWVFSMEKFCWMGVIMSEVNEFADLNLLNQAESQMPGDWLGLWGLS